MKKYHQGPDKVKLIALGHDYRGVDGRLGYLLRLAQQAMRAAIDGAAKAHGLTAPQYAIINILYREPGLTGAEIARQSMLRAQTVNEIVVLLEQRGLTKRKSAAYDQRILLNYLTPLGRNAFEALDIDVRGIEEKAMSQSGTGERVALLKGLLNCVTILERDDQPAEMTGRSRS